MSVEAMAPTVVYIHGAAPQKPAADLKREFDCALFGGPGRSVALRYSQVMWGDRTPPSLIAGLAAAAAEALAPYDAADRIWDQLVAEFGPPDPEVPDAERGGKALLRGLLDGTDDFEQRRVATFSGADVLAYLCFRKARAMQQPVLEQLATVPDPIVVIAHSLGSILAYDLFRRPDFMPRNIRLLVTAGSPLGLPFVHRFRGQGPGPNPLSWIPEWTNFADPEDNNAADSSLADDYRPAPPRIRDVEVDNQRANNHDLPGYLECRAVRDVVFAAMGPAGSS